MGEGSAVAAGLWGLVAGSALIVGAALAFLRPWSSRTIGLVMAFGSGVLFSAVAFDLVEESLDRGGERATAIGLTLGALTYFAGDLALTRRGAAHRKRMSGQVIGADATVGEGAPDGGDGGAQAPSAIVLGAVLDGIPESAAIGISLLEGGHVGGVFVAAVFLSNVPEALSASVGLERRGTPRSSIMSLWELITVVSGLAALAGFVLLDGAGDGTIAGISAFAGGAVLTMLASTMLPEAHREGGPVSGLVTSAGFLVAVLLGYVA